MLQEKTRGNLSQEETQVLSSVLSDLRLAFVQISKSTPGAHEAPQPVSQPEPEPKVESTSVDSEPESRKRFTKSYGS